MTQGAQELGLGENQNQATGIQQPKEGPVLSYLCLVFDQLGFLIQRPLLLIPSSNVTVLALENSAWQSLPLFSPRVRSFSRRTLCRPTPSPVNCGQAVGGIEKTPRWSQFLPMEIGRQGGGSYLAGCPQMSLQHMGNKLSLFSSVSATSQPF